ncbi:hypothetical protein [Phocaeicola coprocola]|uniref:hypothetical protein n=1 Tax=Phocaeicola coprocola TaxID=310298 RepID=UPI00266F0524|nr:hypothetical protein [Phocaeicola coprocola]
MRATEVSNKLDELYRELESVRGMSESEVCSKYNADCKQDIEDIIEEEIESLRSYECDDYSEDDGMDYICLQQLQGLPVICW